jgi:uncharacterized membrane protein HdeD (DUF308 family)
MAVIKKTPSWVRGAQIVLGVLVIILSIYALAFPKVAFISVVYILSIILFFVGSEQILVGIFIRSKSRWASIGLGILILVFSGIALSFPVGTAYVVIVFLGIALLFSGIARLAEGFAAKVSGGLRALLIGTGILAIVLSILVMVSPLFGAALAGVIIAIGLLITGMYMVAAGVEGTRLKLPGTDALK